MPQLKQFLLALSFYTRLPSPQAQDYTKLPQAVLYLPLVGGITAASFYLADLLWPQSTATSSLDGVKRNTGNRGINSSTFRFASCGLLAML